jgi:hypothetical protein
MLQPPEQHEPSDHSRGEIFRLLVVAQDYAMSVPESRQLVCDRFGISESQVRRIEQEGRAGRWPPLGTG